MSIHDEIIARIDEGRLFPLDPTLPGTPVRRPVFVSPDLHQKLLGPWTDDDLDESRWIELRADIDTFISGGRVSVGPHGYLSHLKPYEEVWEIRSINPRPSVRVFCRFADTDTLIAHTVRARKPLAGEKSIEWGQAIRDCKATWRALFPAYNPHFGDSISAYISEHVDLVWPFGRTLVAAWEVRIFQATVEKSAL